ncbi:permease prefix domain 1-containing protein [Agromyces sp. MMS24-K17]|uniref:permease prefix domain 1-containing protein n=1 Tax=Agromyces sp. MMS24-K17 TaxID=3372850 RepID=UPI00375515DD
MSTEPIRPTGGSIHRLLDEAFAGIEPTPDVQDLKEEMRTNLVARVDELEASGVAPDRAARQAIDELGDVRGIVTEVAATDAGPRSAAADHLRHRVRPRPAFVVRTVLLSLLAAAALAVVVLEAAGLLAVGLGGLAVAVAAIALPLGWVTADALRQETTTNHPLPAGRAAGFGAAVALTLGGLGIGWLVVRGLDAGWLVAAAVATVAGIALFSWLGATTTNRHKSWVLGHQAGAPDAVDAFSQDPAAAARFGMYTVVLWLVAITVFVVLSLTVGWAWSWLALVAAFALWFLLLARMLFPPKR